MKILFVFLLLVGCSQTAKVPDGPVVPTTGRLPIETPPARSTVPVDTLKAGELPRVGVILGPGGLKTAAHLGVLREFEKRRIPVHAIVGLEWGSLMGALYSHRASTNDMEWQIFKLKADNLPESGVLAGKLEPAPIKKMQSYFDLTLVEKTIDDGKTKFACPAMTLAGGKMAWFESGRYQDAVKKCLPLAPLFEPQSSWVAAAFEVEEAASKLRQMGAQIVIFVDVLARGIVLKESRYVQSEIQQSLWYGGIRRISIGARSVDWVVGVHGRNYDVGDWSGLRSFVVFGQEAGAKAAQMIAEKYGF